MHYADKVKRAGKIAIDMKLIPKLGDRLAFLYAVLEYLTDGGRQEIIITAKELAEAINKPSIWVYRNLKKLQKTGYITVKGEAGKGYIIRVNQAVSQ